MNIPDQLVVRFSEQLFWSPDAVMQSPYTPVPYLVARVGYQVPAIPFLDRCVQSWGTPVLRTMQITKDWAESTRSEAPMLTILARVRVPVDFCESFPDLLNIPEQTLHWLWRGSIHHMRDTQAKFGWLHKDRTAFEMTLHLESAFTAQLRQATVKEMGDDGEGDQVLISSQHSLLPVSFMNGSFLFAPLRESETGQFDVFRILELLVTGSLRRARRD